MRSLLMIVSLLILAACSPTGVHEAAKDPALDVQEAVFRHQFEHNASSQKQSADFYCLALRDKQDPPEELMRRFASHSPRVFPASQCTTDAHSGVSHGGMSGGGLVFSITEIKWLSDSEVEVSGGYYEGGLSSSGNVYRLKRVAGKWQVVEDGMEWIS